MPVNNFFFAVRKIQNELGVLFGHYSSSIMNTDSTFNRSTLYVKCYNMHKISYSK